MASPPERRIRLVLGTRGSRLALAQAALVKAEIEACHPQAAVEVRVIRTSGDRFAETSLTELGGKGLFVKEIEEALLEGSIDCAVHSMKDLPADVPAGLQIAAIPVRECAYDVLVTSDGRGVEALPARARVGTTSLRRAALLRSLQPDLEVVSLRGNVDTRLRKLEEGLVDAVVLAAAGLRRLGLEVKGVRLDPVHFIPAIGQGALAIETRDDTVAGLAAALDDADTRVAVEAERAFMRAAGGSCRTPLAAHAELTGEQLRLRGVILAPDGSHCVRGEETRTRNSAQSLGTDLAHRLLDDGGREILRRIGEGV